MNTRFHFAFWQRSASPLWQDISPVRSELFGVERLEQHAESLAIAQAVTGKPPVVLSLQRRLDDNATVLLAAYRASAAIVENGGTVVPAAEWLLDNYHMAEEQIREIRDDLPPGYYRQLPKLSHGAMAGYPRVFGLAWAYVAHTDSHLDRETLRRFIVAYQRVQPLTIGELWAVAITLRIVLIENLRRLADQITVGRAARADADALTHQLLESGCAHSALENDIASRSRGPLSELFAAQLAKRLRDQDPHKTPALGWLEDRLRQQDSSIEEVVQHAQQRLGASNVSVRNIITSMRMIADIDWSEFFESVSLVDVQLRAASNFAAMDFSSRNLYRSAIEQLARGSSLTELEVTDFALNAAQTAMSETSTASDIGDSLTSNIGDSLARQERLRDPGYYLIAEGRPALESSIGFRPSSRLRMSRCHVQLGMGGYIFSILVLACGLLAIALQIVLAMAPDTGYGWIAGLAALWLVPATDVATGLVNRFISRHFGALILPGLALKGGVPPSCRTMVVIPALLTSEASALALVEQLEVHCLAGADGDIFFALLLDGTDAGQAVMPGDAHLQAVADAAIARLNARHAAVSGMPRFMALHRPRVFNPKESVWMGWERKRGKLHELNRLLRGATDTTFTVDGHTPAVPDGVRYVITLDADTRLPRDAASGLIGKMAHPLNRPLFSENLQRVVGGYGILQPRVTPSLPIGREGSFYQRVFSSPGGIDPYSAAVSDVYQDLFGEGSFTGKGIYDVDAFEAALAGRIPENTLLSHDLFEGVFARAGLASDIEVVEEFPTRYDVASKRQDRWTRGDWQLLPWILRTKWSAGSAGIHILPAVGRGKMLDNLRRSLVAPATLVALGLGWCLSWPAALAVTLLVLTSIMIPAFLPCVFCILPRRSGIGLQHHSRMLLADLQQAAAQTILTLAFLPDQAWRMTRAISKTLWRLCVTQEHLLEWVTNAQSSECNRLDLDGFYRQLWPGTALGLVVAACAIALSPDSWSIALPFTLLWLLAPALALWASQSPSVPDLLSVSDPDSRQLRLTARRTWRFFETFVTAAENMLPPDNFQASPRPVVAHRTSPTNMGLYLLSAVAAHDFGWTGMTETIERLEATLNTMQQLVKFRGHFYNWYGTQDLQALAPAYVSSVDSGNLAGHLIALANACDAWRTRPLTTTTVTADAKLGMQDNLALACEVIHTLPAAHSERGRKLASILEDFETRLDSSQAANILFPTLKRLADKAARAARELVPVAGDDPTHDLVFWIEALVQIASGHERDRLQENDNPLELPERLQTLVNTARTMAMDFSFLLNPERKLLSIGYSLSDDTLDSGCYDLLASEARLASLFAIAKGDVETRHWFRLGRTATPVGKGSALISWSGSMFEYLMPSLVMRAPVGSLLEQTNRLVVEQQQLYGHSLGIPWGVSESAYNARDLEFTYQYSNFGVPGLGLKRGLSDNVVIAPYATGLATMIDPHAAQQNYVRLAGMGALGRYGFYEALDFTAARLPENQTVAIVENVMAHHQGMTIVAIANTLHDGRMRTRFHAEPMIQACELLLHERLPRDVMLARDRAAEVRNSPSGIHAELPALRRIQVVSSAVPVTHLLSNGRYAVMLTTTGAGYSRWRDIAITRWHEDVTYDSRGTFVFLRDTHNGEIWSAGAQPMGNTSGLQEVVFGEDDAEFIRRDGSLTTTMDVLVSGEDDGEVRRVSLTNSGRKPRVIELTSYAELALTTAATDAAHPVFAKLFVVTDYLPECGALIATRRPRSPTETPVWAAHFTVVEGETVADPQYESDRARFIGRGHSLHTAEAMLEGAVLSNTVGTVLDPVFSLRQTLVIPAGKVARVAFWTVVASSKAELLDLIDQHHDHSAFDRARTLAWTQAQVQLRHLDIELEEAADFQRLAAPILYPDLRFRSPAEKILQGAGAQSGLWPHAISGDLPIVLLCIDDIDDIAVVKQLLRAHEYWRMKRLAVDLVILNEHAASYLQDLQIAIDTAVRCNPLQPRLDEALSQGAVYALRADLIPHEACALLHASARITLLARRGLIANQLVRWQKLPPDLRSSPGRQSPSPNRPAAIFRPTSTHRPPESVATAYANTLECFNGLGGFDKNGREYVTVLDAGNSTPAPWINVIANSQFGFQVSAEGSGYVWAENSRENQLTPWSNDPVTDHPGEAFFVRDEDSGQLCTPTALPLRDSGTYIARHGFGYSRFEHEANGIALDLLQYVPLVDPIRISRLTLHNRSGEPRRLSITAYSEWVLGTSRGNARSFITTGQDANSGILLARNPWNNTFRGRVAFADLAGRQTAWTADRTEFIGRNGHLSAPAALTGRARLSGSTGAGLDPCAALQCVVELGAGESIEVVAFLGQCPSVEEARALVMHYRAADLDAVLQDVRDHWQHLLGAVQVTTPDRAMDILLNGWLLYQTIACRVLARSAFYQASGAYGFRDQLQDGMALTFSQPDETRRHLLRAASRQFVEGDVQHWWLPHSGQGVRTRISDDRVWLAYATASYIIATGDSAILDASVPFLAGPPLADGAHDAFYTPADAGETASLFEHCARGLDQCLTLTGALGLPLIGTGDWNDGMNCVGEAGKGESVWLGWLLLRTLALFTPHASKRDAARAKRWETHATALRAALEGEAWDGEWYRRATFDDGSWLGSKSSDECKIDSIAQSWAVLSRGADPVRAATAMASLEKHLIREYGQLALLFTPPFDKTPHNPGYIKGYPPGLRENGGQYSHAAMWAVLAFAQLGEGDKAFKLFSMLNPINHARTPEDAARYKVEPYVVAADVYSVAPHVGRGGWTWYTGAAGWMYRAGVEGILGIRREGEWLVIDPCIPTDWPGFEARISTAKTHYDIRVKNASKQSRGITAALLDDKPLACTDGVLRVPLDGGRHVLDVMA